MKTIAIIPARGGSKRIPQKNIKDFFGKPIIAYSLESAKKSEIFDCIHVSTDSEKITNLVSDLGFKPGFYRSKKCADDQAPVKDVLIETIQQYDQNNVAFDVVCLLSATTPLINSGDLKAAYLKFKNSDMSSPMLAVSKFPVPVEWSLKMDAAQNNLIPSNVKSFFKSSHDFKDQYYDIGSFAFFTREQLLSNSNEVKFIPYILPQHKALDLDTMDDWQMLEKLYKVQLMDCKQNAL